MTHTPGPWRQHSTAPDRIIVNGSCVYRVRDMTTNEDGQYGRPNPGDVQLMAAAPELLEALIAAKGTIEYLLANSDNGPAENCIEIIADAIAKAEGRGE